MSDERAVLSISDLSVAIDSETQAGTAVRELSLCVQRGQTLAVVGETGSGKTLLALSVMRLLPSAARITGGSIRFMDTSLLDLPEKEMQHIRGRRIAMIFQEPGASLNPLIPVGEQIGEAIRLHQQLDRAACRAQVLSLMEIVGIPDPKRRYRAYPHQLSGGIRQRVVLAGALSCRPDLLVADDPTSALDTTVQAQIVDLLSRLIRDLGMSLLLITHDLGVVAAMADRVAVLYNGYVVEEGSAAQILRDPLHPYTRILTAARTLTGEVPFYNRMLTFDSKENQKGAGRCPFITMCPNKKSICGEQMPGLATLSDRRKVRCIALEDDSG
jgi:peptide/nickel transport system ATP-binding protein